MHVCEREKGAHTTHGRQAGGRERDSSAYTKVSDGGGARSPSKSMVRQAVPLQPVEGHGEIEIHLQSTEDPALHQRDIPWRKSMESQCWSRLWQKL